MSSAEVEIEPLECHLQVNPSSEARPMCCIRPKIKLRSLWSKSETACALAASNSANPPVGTLFVATRLISS